MAPNRDMIDAFVDGRLSAADHDLMVHHISSCPECAAAVIAALAEAARALAAEASERSSSWLSNGAHADAEADERGQPPPDLLQLDLILDRESPDAPDLLVRPENVPEIALDDLPSRARALEARIHPQESTVSSVERPVERPVVAEPPRESGNILGPTRAATSADATSGHASTAVEERARTEAEQPLPVQVEQPVLESVPAVPISEPEVSVVSGVGDASVSAAEAAVAEAERPGPETEPPPPVEAGAAGAADAIVTEQYDDTITTATAAGVALAVANAAAALAEHAVADEPEEEEPISRAPLAASIDAVGVERADQRGYLTTSPQSADTAENPAVVGGDADAMVAAHTSAVRAEPLEHAASTEQIAQPPEIAGSNTDEAPSAPAEERVSDDARAAILGAIQRERQDSRLARRRWPLLVAAAAALLVFAIVGSLAAVHLRSFANSGAEVPTVQTAVAYEAKPGPASVLQPVLDSAAFAHVTDVPAEAAVEAPSGSAAAGSSAGEKAATAAGQRAPSVASGSPTSAPTATGSPTNRSGPRRAERPASVASSVPRLLRTTTHIHGDVVFVLRVYDAGAPAPGSRPGVNEYRWTDESGSRLFVLTGPVDAADLRAFARSLQSARAP